MKTPNEIAQALAEGSNERCRMREAIQADRAQRSSAERFGLHVYSLMNEVDEWNADVFEDIAGIADRLGIPFDN